MHKKERKAGVPALYEIVEFEVKDELLKIKRDIS